MKKSLKHRHKQTELEIASSYIIGDHKPGFPLYVIVGFRAINTRGHWVVGEIKCLTPVHGLLENPDMQSAFIVKIIGGRYTFWKKFKISGHN